MKLVVNAYARSGARSADRIEKTAGKLRSDAAMVFVAGSGFFRSGVCGEVFDIPTVDEGGGAVPSFIAAVLPAETDSEIAVLKSTETAGSPTLRLSAYTGMRAVLSCAYC